MGTNFIPGGGSQVGQVKTSRTIAVTTAAPQQVSLLTSGAVLILFQNIGGSNLTLGDSAMPMGSGDTLHPFVAREFWPCSDNFTVYVRAVSVATVIAVTEYEAG